MPHIISEQGLTLDWLVENGRTYLVVTNATSDGPTTLTRSIELGGSPTMGVPDNPQESLVLKYRLGEQAYAVTRANRSIQGISEGKKIQLEDYVLIQFFSQDRGEQIGVKLYFMSELDRELVERCDWGIIYWFYTIDFLNFLRDFLLRTA